MTTDAIIHEFDPRNVNSLLCKHESVPPVCHCVHDWSIGKWGNAPRSSE